MANCDNVKSAVFSHVTDGAMLVLLPITITVIILGTMFVNGSRARISSMFLLTEGVDVLIHCHKSLLLQSRAILGPQSFQIEQASMPRLCKERILSTFFALRVTPPAHHKPDFSEEDASA